MCALVAFLLFAAPALAASPVAQDDTLKAAPTGVRDVLANDSDSDAPALTVRVGTQPAHGKVACSATGACFYTADEGFTGSDAFTYVARDPDGNESTATVTVDVAASSGSKPLTARDDDVATPAGQGVTIGVLANDSGTGLTLTGSSAPAHGTATCDPSGACRYEPAAGYSGTDGFTYTVADASDKSAGAAVHILIAPAGAGYGIKVQGTPLDGSGSDVSPGGRAGWALGVIAQPAGISGQELGAFPLPGATTGLDGPHGLDAGSLQGAKGWTAGRSGADGVALDARSGALVGDAETQPFPKPLPPISQGTGGDGHVPILVGTKVFAFYHHSFPTSVTCVDRATGNLCPGYPKQLDLGTTDINGPAVVEGSKLWTHLLPNSSYAQTAPIGLYCWDADTDSTCGLTIVDRVTSSGNPGASAPVRAGGKMWFGGDTGQLYCVDPGTGDPCPAIATGLAAIGAAQNYDAVGHDARVFLARRGDAVACVDVSAAGTCPGWGTPKAFSGDWNVVNQYDGAEHAIGVCVFQGNAGHCVTDADPATSTVVNNWVTKDTYSQGYSHSLEAETGTRTLVGSLSSSGVGCYDWTTSAPCTGGGYDASGWLTKDSEGNTLPSAYGVAWDGSCAIALGDPGRVFSVDAAGSSPCLSLRSGAGLKAIDLRDQRCDATVGAATWRDVVLSDAGDGELKSTNVTVRDAASRAVLASGDLVGSGGRLDLSSIDPRAHPAITVDATASSTAGNGAWDDGIPPRLTVRWRSDAQQLCLRTVGADACGPAPGNLGLTGRLAAPASGEDRGRLGLLRRACATPGNSAVLGQSKKACGSRRAFRIRIREPRARKLRSATVTVRGKTVRARRKGHGRLIAKIDLRGLGRKKVVIRIKAVTRSGRKLTGKRTYNPCTGRRMGAKKLFL